MDAIAPLLSADVRVLVRKAPVIREGNHLISTTVLSTLVGILTGTFSRLYSMQAHSCVATFKPFYFSLCWISLKRIVNFAA